MSPAASETVREVGDYFDRPLTGVADVGGIPHQFRLVGWESPETGTWEDFGNRLLETEPGEDRYELVPRGDAAEPIWRRGRFTGTEPGRVVPPDGVSSLRVTWEPIPVRERLDRILEAQRWGGPAGCNLCTPAYLCLRFWLCDEDMDAIDSELCHKNLAAPGEVGRYRSIPVFPLSHRTAEFTAAAQFQGAWFGYLPLLHAD